MTPKVCQWPEIPCQQTRACSFDACVTFRSLHFLHQTQKTTHRQKCFSPGQEGKRTCDIQGEPDITVLRCHGICTCWYVMSKKTSSNLRNIQVCRPLFLSYLNRINSGLWAFDHIYYMIYIYYMTPSDPQQLFRKMREYKGKKIRLAWFKVKYDKIKNKPVVTTGGIEPSRDCRASLSFG